LNKYNNLLMFKNKFYLKKFNALSDFNFTTKTSIFVLRPLKYRICKYFKCSNLTFY